MVMIDTNMILRYLLNDNEEMAGRAEKIIRENSVWVTIEVMAEVVYVLKGVYSIERSAISASLSVFLSEVQTAEPEVLKLGLQTYGNHNLDFVDCILYAYGQVKGYKIETFDKKLGRLLKQK